jgi:transposase
MKKIDARKHSTETQQEIRRQIIRMRKQGLSNRAIGIAVGVSENHASTIWHRYLSEGINGIKIGVRGRRTGEKRSLSPQQERNICKLLIDKTPDQLKLDFALWTRDAVKILIKQIYDIKMPIRTVGEYLKRWRFTPQKPAKRAYEQKPKEVQKWLDEEYPEIEHRAKKEKAEIYWGDETGVQSDANRLRGYSPVGQTPVVRFTAKRNSVNMISAITNEGKVRFMMYRETMTSTLLIKYMSRLVKDAGRKVFLILDNLRVHHSKQVKKWLVDHKEELEVFYLPSYSPERNPDEYLNGNLKTKVHSGQLARSQKSIENKVRTFMQKLLKRPAHVKKYFQHPMIAYAA